MLTLGISLLLPLANPLTTVALFLGLSGGMAKETRNKEIRMASVYVFMIMMVSWYAGHAVMTVFGISIPGLRIAGGLIVAYIGFKMLFPAVNNHSTSSDNTSSVAFVPLAMPSTAGPGTIAMIISSAATTNQVDTPHWVMLTAPVLVFFLVSFILWICLKSADGVMKLLGKGGIDAISRVMGFLLVCMGTQFIINGVTELTLKVAS